MSTVLRSCGFPVRAVALNDMHVRHEVLANITEGTVMGAVVILKGPSASVKAANVTRARDKEIKKT